MEQATATIFQVSPETFQADVVERSQQVPILLLFFAEQVLESRETKETLESLIGQYGEKAALGLVDVGTDQTLATKHLQVRGLPSVRVVHKGQIVQQLDGPQPSTAYKTLLDQLTLSSVDVMKAELTGVLADRDWDSAIAMLQQAMQDEPQNLPLRTELADVLVRAGRAEDARQILESVPEDTEGSERAQNRLEFQEEAAGYGELSELQSAVAEDDDDLESHYRLAVVATMLEDYELALDQAMVILQRDRTYRDDIGRVTMVRIFTLLDKGSELATGYRRRMFNFMH